MAIPSMMRERVRRRNPGEMCAAKKRGRDQCADQQCGEHPRRAQKAYDRRPEKVVLLFDRQRPCGADGGRQREVEEILQKQKVGPPGCGSDCIPDGRADEPWCIEIADDQHQYIDRPDAERTAAVEVAEVVWLAARFKQDRCNQKSRENEEEIDAGPSPKRCGIDPGSGEARMAVIQNHGEDGNAAQSLQFGDVGRQPGWALDFQSGD